MPLLWTRRTSLRTDIVTSQETLSPTRYLGDYSPLLMPTDVNRHLQQRLVMLFRIDHRLQAYSIKWSTTPPPASVACLRTNSAWFKPSAGADTVNPREAKLGHSDRSPPVNREPRRRCPMTQDWQASESFAAGRIRSIYLRLLLGNCFQGLGNLRKCTYIAKDEAAFVPGTIIGTSAVQLSDHR